MSFLFSGQTKPKDLSLLTYEYNMTNVDELLHAPIAVSRPKADWEKAGLDGRKNGAFAFDGYSSFEAKDGLVHKLAEGLARGRRYLKGGGKKLKRKGEGRVSVPAMKVENQQQPIDIFADIGLSSTSFAPPLSNAPKSAKAVFGDLKWADEEDEIDIMPNREQISKSIKLVAKAADRKGGVYSSKAARPSLAEGEYEDFTHHGAEMLANSDDEANDLKETPAGGARGGGHPPKKKKKKEVGEKAAGDA